MIMFQIDDRRFNRLAIAGLIVGFLLVLAAFAASLWVFRSNTQANALVERTHDIVDEIARLEIMVERAETARRGIVLWPDIYRVGIYQESVAAIPHSIDRLKKLVEANPDQVERVRELEQTLRFHVREMDDSVDLARSGETLGAQQIFIADISSQPTIRAIRTQADAMRSEEIRRLEQRTAAVGRNILHVQYALALTGLLLMLLGAATFWLVRRYTRDLTTTRDRLKLLNNDLESAVDERTRDLTRANEEIQRFAYIVSHDLRSPLVNVMGFTAELDRAGKIVTAFVESVETQHPELVDEEARLAAREDLPEAIGFIRSSTQKMDRLINAILDLSRQGRRVLTPEHMPMDQVIADIADSLAVQAEKRGAAIRIESPLPDINHDRLAVEQLFSNLIENATKYLHPGRAGKVVVRGKRDGKRVRFEVEDNGRGIAPEDHERVFELFRRSGKQDQEGEGIGLANVRALAYRLGGMVTVKSALSEGSTFIVDLPVTFAKEGKEQ
ncbi:sensor histidine kinase [Sphingomonas xanthus]|uniref:histidine kinase n=1 Tax=Sphingomonas xanthus TaxID=2594473 RepID=A0A516IPP3_9SPHN|nr:sensor histidine kinase [Sphingomonas xanthus]QDP18908.1 histidine kinase [Sphingomonas xanthus]